jgi:hypothetical protein
MYERFADCQSAIQQTASLRYRRTDANVQSKDNPGAKPKGEGVADILNAICGRQG